jgi:hypothetical protein
VQDASGLPVDPLPRPVEGLPASEVPVRIGAGFYNTFVACESGQLYCSGGKNSNVSPLHAPPPDKPLCLFLSFSIIVAFTHSSFLSAFVVVALTILLSHQTENQNRQCGIEVTSEAMNIPRMQRVADLKGERVRHAQGGYCHTLALLLDGRVLTMGCGDDGQRGDGIKPDGKTTYA